MTFDVGTFRGHFPALSREENGEPVVWMDGPGGSQAPVPVIDAIGELNDRVTTLEVSNDNLKSANDNLQQEVVRLKARLNEVAP